jgi:hypothetical protein
VVAAAQVAKHVSPGWGWPADYRPPAVRAGDHPQTEPTAELAAQIVRQLVPADDQTISSEDVRELCRQHPTNLREVLFGLYDLYRRRTE